MTIHEITRQKLQQFPQFKASINDLYEMAVDEIADGGSEFHEIELFEESVKELTEGVE